MSIQAIAQVRETTPITAAPGQQRVVNDTTVSASRKPAGDTLVRQTAAGSVPATVSIAQEPQDDPNAVDFTKLFKGFAVGGTIKIGCSIPLAGGKGKLEALDKEHLKLSGKISVVGVINKELDVELHKETDGTYRMTGTCELHAAIVQQGNKMTITDLDYPTHQVVLTATKDGNIAVKTTGMGFDKIGASVKAK